MSDLHPNEERRPKRRLFTFWRIATTVALGLVAYALFAPDPSRRTGPYVAVHDVVGFIGVDAERDALLRGVASDDDALALVLRIDSPGGTTTGAEALFETVRGVAEDKPVVAVMGEIGASGGYIAAIAADHVIARGNTLTGSIGVVRQRPNITGLLDQLGVTLTEERSDVFKANPSYVSNGTPATEAWDREVLMDAYRWFRDLVGERRGLEGLALKTSERSSVSVTPSWSRRPV
ncbi:MAG: S49 family peptidase, partial [Pseudomonadota bacterium]